MTQAEYDNMAACIHFESCDANMCPRDVDISRRTWIVGEDVCHFGPYRKNPLIKRQKYLNKRKPVAYLDQALTYTELIESIPKKRVMTEEQRQRIAELGKKFRFAPSKDKKDGP